MHRSPRVLEVVATGQCVIPSLEEKAGLCAQVPPAFKFAFEVTDEVPIRRFPNLTRFGPPAGTVNDHFLDADMFR